MKQKNPQPERKPSLQPLEVDIPMAKWKKLLSLDLNQARAGAIL